MSAGNAVLELFANTVSAQTNTVFAMETLVRAATNALGFRSLRGEAASSASEILECLDRAWRVP